MTTETELEKECKRKIIKGLVNRYFIETINPLRWLGLKLIGEPTSKKEMEQYLLNKDNL